MIQRGARRAAGPLDRCGAKSSQDVSVLAVYMLTVSMLGAPLVLAGCARDESPEVAAPTPRAALASVANVSAELPRRRADAGEGARHWERHCAHCHGATGAGNGPLAATLDPRPPNFEDAAYMAGQRPSWFHRATQRGVIGSSMKRFDATLDEQALWDVAFFAWSRPTSAGLESSTRPVFEARCASCHGSDGRGVTDAPLDDPRLANRSRAELRTVLDAIHPDALRDLDDAGRNDLVDLVFTYLYEPAP